MSPVGRKMSASSADLSSPPKSPESPQHTEEDSIVVTSTPINPSATEIKQESSISTKPKRIRKPKLAADGTEIVPKPRKSRAKKKENDPPATATAASAGSTPSAATKTTAASASKSAAAPATPSSTSKPSRQSKINDLMNSATNSKNTAAAAVAATQPKTESHSQRKALDKSESVQAPSPKSDPSTGTSLGNNQVPIVVPQPHAPPQNYISHSPTPSISTRGQNYDPVRSSTITVPRSVPSTNPSTPVLISPIKAAPRASTSPSIASLINPPTASSEHTYGKPSPSFSPTQPLPAQLVPQTQVSTFASTNQTPLATPHVKSPTPPPPMDQTDAMDIDAKSPDASRKTSISTGSAASPNPTKAKDKPPVITPKLPPLPGQGFATEKVSGARAIVIHVPLKGERNKYVNFQQLAVQKYGFNAVYPKLALQKDHLARVAANAAALERKAGGITSNDEMSLDGSDNEAELSSGSKRKGPTEADEPTKKKRLTYEDMYDKDDPFVDDSEMAWEEQAAAVKDGFFVYSGPLIPPGGEATVEKADGSAAPKKRSRPSRAGASKSSSSKTTTTKPEETDKDKKEEEKKDVKTTSNGVKDTVDAKKAKPAAPPRKRPTKAEADARRAERERIAKEKAAAAAVSSTTGQPASTNTPAKSTAASTADSNSVAASTNVAPIANTEPKPTPAVPSPA